MKRRYQIIFSNIIFILKNENLLEDLFLEFIYNLAEKFNIEYCINYQSENYFFTAGTNGTEILSELDFIYRVFNLEENIQDEELELVCYYGIYAGMEVEKVLNYCNYLKEKSSYLNHCTIA